MIELLIIAPIEKFRTQVPRGFNIADDVFSEAKLNDPISKAQTLTSDLQRALHYLAHHYPRRIRTQWVEQWSPGGLWCALRYRLRSYPAVVLNQREILTGSKLEFKAFIDHISNMLANPEI